MTAQAKHKSATNKSSQKNTLLSNNGSSSSYKKAQLISIANDMLASGNFSGEFVVNALQTALKFEGVSDLMHFWAEEDDLKVKDEIIADIQDMIEACKQKNVREEMYIKFNDLDAIARDIRAFKDSLYQKVMERGGISKLAELTGIPQPSLSRFFNSNSMPRRSTVLTIANALNLDKLPIDMKWSK